MAPLGRIGLSLSGGGYRAAGFHLGTLDLLWRLGLLSDVAVLSTVSGGTLIGCRYALALARAETFPMFFRQTYRFLERTNVVTAAVESLSRDDAPRPRALIAGAARVYAQDDFLGAATMATLMDAKTHLQELSFNATEFRTGLAFRFQVGAHRGRIGNRRVAIPRETTRLVRLADVAAASSCFPGGFEPFVFPDDFTLPPGFVWTAPPIPLLDGGIYDNQGTAALLLAHRRGARRRGSDRRIALFIISDTHARDALAFERPRRKGAGMRIGRLAEMTQLLLLIAAGSTLALGVETRRAIGEGRFHAWQALTLGFPLLFIGGATVGGLLLWRQITREIRARTPAAVRPVLKALRHLGVREVLDLVEVRVRSLVALTSQVFMGRVRDLGYERLYSRSEYEGRRVSNLIYDIVDAAQGKDRGPTAAQRALAERALQMPTTLWFDDKASLRDLVACGQNTIAFNLLEHLAQPKVEIVDAAEAAALAERVREVWPQLGEDPWRLVDEHLRE
jgi:hypothetical protein